MNGLPYYKAYPRDFVEGTIGMPFELKAAYRLVLDLIYMQGGELPDDARYISGLLGCSVRAWKKYRDELISAGKIYAKGGVISNSRADKELETLAKLQDKQRENATGPRKNNDLAKPRLNHTEPEPEPDNTPNPPEGVDDGFDQFWERVPKKAGRGQARKAFKAALKKTDLQTILDGIDRYAVSVRDKSKQYIAHPSTWLNGERWADEVQSNVLTFRDKPESEWNHLDRKAAMMRYL